MLSARRTNSIRISKRDHKLEMIPDLEVVAGDSELILAISNITSNVMLSTNLAEW